MFNQIRLSAWSTGVRNKLSLPLRIELWNGERLDFSPEPPRVTIRIPDAAAVRYLLSPSLYNLGTAYVEGAIDVSGHARDMFRVVGALAANNAPRNGLMRSPRNLSHPRDSQRLDQPVSDRLRQGRVRSGHDPVVAAPYVSLS